MKLVYRAVTRDRKILKGYIEAKDIQEAASFLRSKDILPIAITVKKNDDILLAIPFLKHSSVGQVVFFTRQLASMLTAGLTLVEALRILSNQMQNQQFGDVLKSIILNVEEGLSFSAALAKYPDIFNSIYVSLIKAGESSGILDEILVRLSENLEKQQRLKSLVKSALIYPIIIIVGMIGVVFVMMFFVIPQMNDLYKSLKIDLPLPTQIIVNASNFTIDFWPIIIMGVIGAIVGFNIWHRTVGGKYILDKIILILPIFGNLARQSTLSEFTRVFGLLIGTGTVVVESIQEAAEVVTNTIFKRDIQNAAKRVEKGISISESFEAYPIFPPLLIQMMKVGEETGKLDESLIRAADYYERQVEDTVKNLTTAIEPIIMILLGLGVAFLVISVLTPIYTLISNFK